MTRSKLLTQVLFALLCLQTAFLLGAHLPNATANEPDESIAADDDEKTPVLNQTTQGLTCRYFEMNEAEMKAEGHGEIDISAPTGEIQKFLSDENAQRKTHSLDFEIGQSINGTPIYWVQICLSEA
jgi:hypothetical protein